MVWTLPVQPLTGLRDLLSTTTTKTSKLTETYLLPKTCIAVDISLVLFSEKWLDIFLIGY